MPKYNPLNQIFHALADPTRRTITERLAQSNATVSELATPFDMALPSLMQHLGVLEQAGLVRSSKTGRTRTYELEPQAMQALEDWLNGQRDIWQRRLNQLDDYVQALKEETTAQTPAQHPPHTTHEGD